MLRGLAPTPRKSETLVVRTGPPPVDRDTIAYKTLARRQADRHRVLHRGVTGGVTRTAVPPLNSSRRVSLRSLTLIIMAPFQLHFDTRVKIC